jgi:hypothetical protein
VYELTEYGEGLREVLHVLAHWGARSLGPPTSTGDLQPGWLADALSIALPLGKVPSAVEFRIGDEVASVADGVVLEGALESPAAVVSGDATGFFRLLVDRDTDAVAIEGDPRAIDALLASLPRVPPAEPAAATAR